MFKELSLFDIQPHINLVEIFFHFTIKYPLQWDMWYVSNLLVTDRLQEEKYLEFQIDAMEFESCIFQNEIYFINLEDKI